MRYTHLDKLFTPEGLVVGAITLAVTVLLCRPKKSNSMSSAGSRGMTTLHSSHAEFLHRFSDSRSPHEMRCGLERLHMIRFQPVVRDGRLVFAAGYAHGGLPCEFMLAYESADSESDHYTLQMRMSWAHLRAEVHDYYRGSAESWFDLWSSSLSSASAKTPRPKKLSSYEERITEALAAESDLRDVSQIQLTIMSALREGAIFSISHKEGGTRIGFAGGKYFREDFGECPARQCYDVEESFPGALRQFFDADISKGSRHNALSEEDAWILILRRLDHG